MVHLFSLTISKQMTAKNLPNARILDEGNGSQIYKAFIRQTAFVVFTCLSVFVFRLRI